MTILSFDYILFEKSSGKVSSGKYQREDYGCYRAAFNHTRSEDFGTIRYAKFSNSNYVLIVRCPTLPEFVNPRLRHLSFNSFSYLFFLILELNALPERCGASFFASGRAKSKERFVLSSGSFGSRYQDSFDGFKGKFGVA